MKLKFYPLSFSEWCYESDIESQYQRLHNEYGDAACSLSEYKDRMYQEYLENLKKSVDTL